MSDHDAFFIPGLWDRFEGDDGMGNQVAVDSCVMLMCDANELVASTRKGRMRQPVVMADPDAVARYCSSDTEHDELRALFEPWPSV